MTASPSRTLAEWLDALILADSVDRRSIALDGCDDGVALRKVHCKRCDKDLNWLSAFRHLDRTEASQRLQHGADTRLHQPGDLVPVFDQWPAEKCGRRGCSAQIVWASTTSGSSIPVDAVPNPAGNVVLTRSPGGGRGRPLAIFLHTEAARSATSADAIHMTHAQTCRGKA